jgi:hypothetical protein
MLNSEESNQRATANETVIEEQFKSLNSLVKPLDSKSSKRKRPDFLISNSCGPQMLCEVKTIDSGGYMHDKGVHVSTRDETLGKFECPVSLTKIDERLANAVQKYKALVEDDSRCTTLPLLVAFFFDQLAEFLPFHPLSIKKRDERFPEVSGILTIKEDVVMPTDVKNLSVEERGRYLEKLALKDDLLHTKHFVLLQNEAALRKVPQDFERQCHRYRLTL